VNGGPDGKSAYDESLLEMVNGAEADFLAGKKGKHENVEGAVRIFLEFLRGFEFLQIAEPCVTVFGSARFKEGHPYYEQARELGAALAKAGYAVMTGGGPGIMEAANRGCQEAGGLSIGANIHLPQEQQPNPFVDRYMMFEHFFVRKVMMVKYSCAFVVCPGGFGTMDEIFETLTLIQTEKIEDFPVVTLGTEYWQPLLDFFQATMLEQGMIAAKDIDLLYVTDSIEKAVSHIDNHPHGCRRPLGSV
jgi:uncharacterized protein (TIGR00730 family)